MIESMVKYKSQALVLKDPGIYKDGVKNTFYLFSEKKVYRLASSEIKHHSCIEE